jgi:hypothetical protein
VWLQPPGKSQGVQARTSNRAVNEAMDVSCTANTTEPPNVQKGVGDGGPHTTSTHHDAAVAAVQRGPPKHASSSHPSPPPLTHNNGDYGAPVLPSRPAGNPGGWVAGGWTPSAPPAHPSQTQPLIAVTIGSPPHPAAANSAPLAAHPSLRTPRGRAEGLPQPPQHLRSRRGVAPSPRRTRRTRCTRSRRALDVGAPENPVAQRPRAHLLLQQDGAVLSQVLPQLVALAGLHPGRVQRAVQHAALNARVLGVHKGAGRVPPATRHAHARVHHSGYRVLCGT